MAGCARRGGAPRLADGAARSRRAHRHGGDRAARATSFTAELRKRLQGCSRSASAGRRSTTTCRSARASWPSSSSPSRPAEGGIPEVQSSELEAEIVAACRSWEDELRDLLRRRHGDAAAQRLASVYGRAPAGLLQDGDTSPSWRCSTSSCSRRVAARRAVRGRAAERAPRAHAGGRPPAHARRARQGRRQRAARPVPAGARGPRPDRHRGDADAPRGPEEDGAFLHDFGVLVEGEQVDIACAGQRCWPMPSRPSGAAPPSRTRSAAWSPAAAWAGATSRSCAPTAATASSSRRRSPRATRTTSCVEHSDTSRLLVELFRARFADGDAPAQASLLGEIRRAPGRGRQPRRGPHPARASSSSCRRRCARTRTRAAATTTSPSSCARPTCRGMPRPYPLYEIFVYSTQMEGIHLRGGPIARGGIRWSDRREDYRTEILGLMKAQMVKNAVIVPEGSKGGFVLRNVPADRDELQGRGHAPLLDAHPGHARHHRQRRRRRGRASRGRARSTTARIPTSSSRPTRARPRSPTWPTTSPSSAASGSATRSPRAGRTGYDHKALGITARGAWESVKRHFRELGHDVMSQPFTVVGVGDMSGDVFGNGMLLSQQIQLVAAFDHRHVFLDPNPDPAASFAERKRLFELGAGTSWADYDRLAHLGRRRRLPALRQVGRSSRPRRARRSASTPSGSTPHELGAGDPARARRPVLERRHRHVRQGLERVERRRRRPHQRRDPHRRPRPARPRRRRGRQPRADAGRAHRVRDGRRPASTPTRSTTPRASTARTTRSTSRSCSAWRSSRARSRRSSATRCWPRWPTRSASSCSTTTTCRCRSSARRRARRPRAPRRTRS